MPNPDPAARRPLKSRELPFFKALAARLARGGVSPNAISFASIVFGIAAGGALSATAHSDGAVLRIWFLAAAAGIQLRLVANLLDGMVAVEGRRGGPTGDLWNEAPDRVSDAATIIGAGLAAGSAPLLGFAAALMAVFVAYVRALGASVGAGQCFLGPQAKPHRMAVLTVACLFSAAIPGAQGMFAQQPVSAVAVALWVMILGGAVTAVRRLAFIARYLRTRTS
ncbi:MAG: hypothetical protein QOE70_6826 [Chthoniobacter sp.]|jgi:phosphatidylglycerophosphate synthase|nr:hypothetical protein [Chthoniobacter sp.]